MPGDTSADSFHHAGTRFPRNTAPYRTVQMNTIYKYDLGTARETHLSLPSGAKILRVDFQGATPKLWAEVSTGAPLENRTIEVFGTGHEMPPGERVFMNTFCTPQHTYVVHSQEKIRP